MKLHEIADPNEHDVFHVHGEDDIMGALKASLMHDWLIVDMGAHPGLSDQQLEADVKAIKVMAKKVAKYVPKLFGSNNLTINLHSSEELKKLLDLLNEYFKPGQWRWAASISNWDLDT